MKVPTPIRSKQQLKEKIELLEVKWIKSFFKKWIEIK
jgi:hypothetical protein